MIISEGRRVMGEVLGTEKWWLREDKVNCQDMSKCSAKVHCVGVYWFGLDVRYIAWARMGGIKCNEYHAL